MYKKNKKKLVEIELRKTKIGKVKDEIPRLNWNNGSKIREAGGKLDQVRIKS